MVSKAVEINCWCGFFNFHLLRRHLSSFDEYKCTALKHSLLVDLKIDGKNIKINLTVDWMKTIHVCLIDMLMDPSKVFIDAASERAQRYKEKFPTASFIIVCHRAEREYFLVE